MRAKETTETRQYRPIGGSASAAYDLLPAKDCPGGVDGPTCTIGGPRTRIAQNPGRSTLSTPPCREVALSAHRVPS